MKHILQCFVENVKVYTSINVSFVSGPVIPFKLYDHVSIHLGQRSDIQNNLRNSTTFHLGNIKKDLEA